MEAIWSSGESIARGVAKILGSHGVDRGRVLDLGCGIGRVAIPLASMGFEVVGVDCSARFVEEARERAKAFNVEGRVKFVQCDYKDILRALANGYFDAVLSAWTSIGFGSEEEDLDALKKAKLVSRRGALLVVEVENKLRYCSGVKRWTERYGNLVVQREGALGEDSRWRSKWVFYDGEGGRFLGEYHDDVRFYSAEELRALVEEAGWTPIGFYSDLACLKPLSSDSENIVLVAKNF